MSTASDPISPTATDTPLCGVCPNASTITCATCNNMKYCSAACQQRDTEQHNTLCGTFREFQVRPSPNHFRSIYFPENDVRPRFIWLRMDGERGFQDVNEDDLAQYVSGKWGNDIVVTAHHGFRPVREYKHRMTVDYDELMPVDGSPINQCLISVIGPEAEHFRGSYVARGYKYTQDTKPEDRDIGDADITGNCDIALDLDTTSLGPLLAWFKNYIVFEQKMCSFQ